MTVVNMFGHQKIVGICTLASSLLLVSQCHNVGTILNNQFDEVVETNPEQCIAEGGYLSGIPYRDCCSFVQCDPANGNKTGILKLCFFWVFASAWDNKLKACTHGKWLSEGEPPCSYDTDCPFHNQVIEGLVEFEIDGIEPNEQCPVVKEANTCCRDGNETFGGYIPLIEFDPDDDKVYRTAEDRFFQTCPFNQIFNSDTCFCETKYEILAECADTSEFYFEYVDDPCCSFIQCFTNRTGYTVEQCMPPTVWNDVNKTCDIRQSVMECMNVECGAEMTDPPCEGDLGTCCRGGLWYEVDIGNPNIYYIVNSNNPHHGQCCPEVDGEQWVFNDDEDVCCCEAQA